MAAPRRANGRISRWHAIGNAQWWRGGSGGPMHRDRVPSTVQSVAVMVGRATGTRGRRGTFARPLVQGTVESVVDGSSGCLRVGHTRLIQSCVSSRDVAKNETKSYKQIKRDAGDRAAMCRAVHVKTGASVAAAGRAATRGRAARQSQWRAVGSGRVPCGVACRTRGTKISHHHSRTSSISSIAASKQPP